MLNVRSLEVSDSIISLICQMFIWVVDTDAQKKFDQALHKSLLYH